MTKYEREKLVRLREWFEEVNDEELLRLEKSGWIDIAYLKGEEPTFLKNTTTDIVVSKLSSVDLSNLPREKLIAIHTIITSGTTKCCPKCLSTALARFSSTNTKRCTRCLIDIDWFVTNGQKRL